MTGDRPEVTSPPARSAWRTRKDQTRELLELVYNSVVTHVPSHALRQFWLRRLGAEIGARSALLRGTSVHAANALVVGARTNIGWRVVLDARGGLRIGDDCVISSDTQIITGTHDLDSDDFSAQFLPVVVMDHCWVATRAVVLPGVTMHRGAVAAAGAVVSSDVPAATVVGGVPARPIRTRGSSLDYRLDHKPLLS